MPNLQAFEDLQNRDKNININHGTDRILTFPKLNTKIKCNDFNFRNEYGIYFHLGTLLPL